MARKGKRDKLVTSGVTQYGTFATHKPPIKINQNKINHTVSYALGLLSERNSDNPQTHGHIMRFVREAMKDLIKEVGEKTGVERAVRVVHDEIMKIQADADRLGPHISDLKEELKVICTQCHVLINDEGKSAGPKGP